MSTASKHIESRIGGRHPYPLVRPGGLFLTLFGVGIIGGVLFNDVVLLVGAGLAIVSFVFAKALSFGKPTRIQILALAIAIVLELVLIILMGRILPPGTEESVRLMVVLIIVGLHFLPMAISFGPRLFGLGALCILNVSAGLFLTSVAAELFLLLDGALKIAFGVWLFSDKARAE